MYTPNSFAVDDPGRLRTFLHDYPFAIVTTAAAGQLLASHLPLLVDSTRGERGVLRGHVAQANPHWRVFDDQTDALVIFQGPHAYVSPQWYVNRPAVPTWNYTAVHVYGKPRVLDDAHEVQRLLGDLTARFEHGPGDELPDELRRSLTAAIVAFEMPIERWEGKFKLSQNRAVDDQRRVVEQLSHSTRAEEQSLAAFMARELPGLK